MIPEGQHQIMIAYPDEEIEDIFNELNQLKYMPTDSRYIGYKLRQKIARYMVSVYDYEYQSMKQNGILTSFMDGLLDIVYQIEGVYDMKTGLLPAKGMDPLAESYIC